MSSLKKVVKFSVLLLSIFLTGCSLNGNIDSLLTPPRLSQEHAKIQAALYDSVGNNIQLKYPKTGDFRSAFVIANIDDEPTEEAISFYTKPGIDFNTDSNIRINILDQENGEWKSVYDHAGSGTEIDQIMISNLTSTDRPNIIIGYQLLNQKDKVLQVYKFSEGILLPSYSETYTTMETANFNEDSLEDLIVINGESADVIPTAKLVRNGINGLSAISEIEMSPSGINYINFTHGKMDQNTPALFIDSDRGDGTIQTQILYTVEGQLRNPIAQIYELTAKTIRPSEYYSIDIDKDGIVEIPLESPMPGYETIDSSQQLYITNWMTYGQFTFVKKNSGFYNIDDGYCFMLPNRWSGSVTVKIDPSTKETVFYKYEGQLDDDMTELMRICATPDEKLYEKLNDGYITVANTEQMNYLVKIPDNSSEPLILTLSEIIYNFIIL